MENENKRRVLVFGSGISGIAAADLLWEAGDLPILYDGNEKLVKEEIRAKLADNTQAEIVLGELPEELISTLSAVVLSPGVPTDLPIVNRLREAGLPILGEIELAFQQAKGDVLAITGTNGKTTTTSLLGAIMKEAYDSSFIVGNIGIPYTMIAKQTEEKSVTVAEISSFQLETIDTFHPKVSAILNITPDHLNRHHTMEEYIRVKELICANQTAEDTCVLNYEDEVLREFGKTLNCRVLYFSSVRSLEEGLYLEGETIVYRVNGQITEICTTDQLNLPGRHNHENVMAAVGMALAYGVSLEVIRKVLFAFKAVEHRIEFVKTVNGVDYYNDSKGTNPDAAIKGIQAMNRPTLLIGGGYDKNSSYEEWIQAFDGKVKYLVLIGQTREKIAETARACGFDQIVLKDSLEDAVAFCAENSVTGDAVLLSPACASWGMFPNYEVRGRRFKELVQAL
ncbi:MAG: UDP-N-acetylmuramoyl-L-alanine--D-glutamate ligase [Eubacteriales bacterium]|nr:UDP-N-acetylmuramoyl-L-alanine--D-glutamate ligase [Eubacteriales bacterium]